MTKQNVVAVKNNDKMVLIDLDELVYFNFDGDALYLYFKNAKIDFEINDDDIISQLITILWHRLEQ